MEKLTISLPKDLKKFVEEQVATGTYGTPGDYLATLVLLARKHAAELQLIKLVQEAEASGPAKEMTKPDWKRIREVGLKRLKRTKLRHASNRQKTRSRK